MDRMEILFATLIAVGLICMLLITVGLPDKTDKKEKTSEETEETDKLVSLMVLGEYKLNLTKIMNGVPQLKPQYLWDIDIHGASTLSPVLTVSVLDTTNMMNKTEIATIQAKRDEWVPAYSPDHKLWYDASQENRYNQHHNMNRMMENWYAHIQKYIIDKTPVEYTLADNAEFNNFQF